MFKLVLLVWDVVSSIGSMPDVKDETAFRAFCQKLATALGRIAALTNNAVDDKGAALLLTVCTNDMYWSAFYAALLAALEFGGGDNEHTVGSVPPVQEGVVALDPATWIVVIEAVVALIKALRKRS